MTDFISSKTEQIAHDLLEQLFSKIWEGVAERNVAKMAPRATHGQHKHAVESLVYHNFAQKYSPMGKLAYQKDPIPACMDTIAAGVVSVEHKLKKSEKSVNESFMGDRSRSRVSEIEIRSMKSNKISVKNNKQVTTERQMSQKKQSFFVSLGYEEEKEEKIFEKLRDVENSKTQQQIRLKRQLQQRQAQKKLLHQANEKLLKQKNLYTYNYEGDLQEITYGKLNNDSVRKMREQLSKNDVSPRQKMAIQPTRIESQKHHKEEKQASKLKSEQPEFSAKTLSIAEALADISKVAEGVKITDLKNGKEGITLEHKARKLDGLRQYRLNDFKNIAKEKSFVEFSHSSSKKKQSLDYSASEQEMSDLKSRTALVQRNAVRTRGKSQREFKAGQTQMVLQKALGRGLPFIRTKGLRFNDLGTTNTFRTLQPNSTARKASRSRSHRIKIGDASLYEQTFFQ